MSLENSIKSFVQLGLFLNQFKLEQKNPSITALNDVFYDDFKNLVARQQSYNGWFNKENVIKAISEIGASLSHQNLLDWLSNYTLPKDANKTVGVIMAGNIPLVGFHDFLSVLLSGHKLQAKLSSNDKTLLPKIGEVLVFIDPTFASKISFVDKLENFDAVIATGSNNTSRYFESYFKKYPHIIRKNRNSVAIIHQEDGIDELKALGSDVFDYFGLGCRSISKLYFPKGYRIDTFFEAILTDFQHLTQHNKYANNYDYHKAVYLLGNHQLLDNGFVLLKEDTRLASPVGVLNYEFYESLETLQKSLEAQQNEIQCIVSSKNTPLDTLEFGAAQSPQLKDYADGVDTLSFILGVRG